MSKVLVIGESCTDIFVYCDAIRLAPDLPVPVLQIVKSTSNPGMAANVFRNISAHVEGVSLLTNPNYEQVTKTRYMHESSNHMFIRVDSEHAFNELDLDKVNLDHDVIVVSDYNKGFLTKEIIQNLCEKHDQVFLDTKKTLGSWAEKAAYIKINDYEYKNSEANLTEILKDKIIHTMGAMGCEYQGEIFPVEPREVRDTSGAGDSFMAALVVKYLETRDIKTSIRYANKMASEVVQHRGVGVI
jgi:D-beta-D-heptose 7-phosphate kinase/D-beta-D-heptose 1-phosphate adenosyltransferase